MILQWNSEKVMELTEKEQNIFVFEVLYNICNSVKESNF